MGWGRTAVLARPEDPEDPESLSFTVNPALIFGVIFGVIFAVKLPVGGGAVPRRSRRFPGPPGGAQSTRSQRKLST